MFDVRLTTTGAAADRNLILKPGTDGAVALAIAHVLLTEDLWDRKFVGDFVDGDNSSRPANASIRQPSTSAGPRA